MSSHAENHCPDCNRVFFSGREYCRACAPRHVPVFECERCGMKTYVELTLRDGELQCPRCLLREPDPTEDEILEMAAQLRAERPEDWEMD